MNLEGHGFSSFRIILYVYILFSIFHFGCPAPRSFTVLAKKNSKGCTEGGLKFVGKNKKFGPKYW